MKEHSEGKILINRHAFLFSPIAVNNLCQNGDTPY